MTDSKLTRTEIEAYLDEDETHVTIETMTIPEDAVERAAKVIQDELPSYNFSNFVAQTLARWCLAAAFPALADGSAVVVPVEASDDMVRAGMDADVRMDGIGRHYQSGFMDHTIVINVPEIYRAMLAAAKEKQP